MKTHIKRQQRGFMSMEMAMSLPLLMFVLFAIFEFSMLFFARGDLVEACRLGARQATYPGSSEEDVQQVVINAINPYWTKHTEIRTELAEHAGEPVTVVVRVPMGVVAPDLLWPIGYSLDGQYLLAESRMLRE